jgi:hypothetical protein
LQYGGAAHFDVAPAPGKNFEAAAAPTYCSDTVVPSTKPTFLKVNISIREIFYPDFLLI